MFNLSGGVTLPRSQEASAHEDPRLQDTFFASTFLLVLRHNDTYWFCGVFPSRLHCSPTHVCEQWSQVLVRTARRVSAGVEKQKLVAVDKTRQAGLPRRAT